MIEEKKERRSKIKMITYRVYTDKENKGLYSKVQGKPDLSNNGDLFFTDCDGLVEIFAKGEWIKAERIYEAE